GTDTAYAGITRMAYERKLRRIALIDQPTLARCVSPELMLVDPELAESARELLREPHEGNGKGNMSALGTHEFTAGMSLGLEPPLSPPTVVRGPSAMMPEQTPHHDLPTPPPALRPPDGGMGPELSGPEPEPMPVVPDFPPLEPAAPQAQRPQQP